MYYLLFFLYFLVACSKPLYHKDVRKLNSELNKSKHIIYIISYGMGLNSREVYITLQDVNNKKYYHISNLEDEESFKIDSVSNKLYSKYYKFIFSSIDNKKCDSLIQYSDYASISGVYINDVIYEIRGNKTIRKCEFKKFDLLD